MPNPRRSLSSDFPRPASRDRWCDLRLEDEVPTDQSAYVRETVQRMMLCRDPEAGYARYECPGCGFDLRVPFSCKTRFCPSCGKVRVDEWVNAITSDLLEVPHLHLTLTINDESRPFFHAERALLDDLLQVAAQAVTAVVTDLYPSVRVGMIYFTHTFGRDLGFKLHVHLVMTKGGLKDDAWVEIAEVPGGRLAAKWRYLLCQRLRQRRPEDIALQRVIAQTYVDHHGLAPICASGPSITISNWAWVSPTRLEA